MFPMNDDAFGARLLERSRAAKLDFLRAIEAPEQLQTQLLRRVLELGQDSVFGREHELASVDDARAFRRRVPIRRYADFEPYIERSVAGEAGVLTRDPPIFFFTSSGSTGKHKQLPVTVPFLKEHFVGFVHAALGNFFQFYPETALRDDATVNFKWDPLLDLGKTKSGKPYLGASQVDYARTLGEELAVEPGMRAPWRAPPREIEDPLERLYYRVCFASGSDVRALIGINPAVLASLVPLVEQWAERLIDEAARGTVLGKPMKPPDELRARRLADCRAEAGRLLPLHLWPKLAVLYCWTGAAASIYLPALRASFGPRVSLMTAPIAASEGPIAVPIDRHERAGLLALPFTFLEFVDADRVVSSGSATLGFNELRAGGSYQVVMTQSAGLYRYLLGDVVCVVDFYRGVARVEFLSRQNLVTQGDTRLSDAACVEHMQTALGASGLSLTGFRYFLGADGGVELAVEPHVPWRSDEASCLAAAISRLVATREQVRVRVLEPGAFVSEWSARVRAGARPAQVKDRILETDPRAWAAFCDRSSRPTSG
jgi:GH3 auxin-responsive promoter